MQPDRVTYHLCIKGNNNQYIPVDWRQTRFYRGEDLNSLKEIDTFTSKSTSLDLLRELLRKDLMAIGDNFNGFEIVAVSPYDTYEEIKEGPIFKEDEHVMSEEELIEYIISIRDDEEAINMFLNEIKDLPYRDELYNSFLHVINTISYCVDDIELLRERLEVFKYLTYLQKRTICFRISERIYQERISRERELILNPGGNVA